MAKCGVCFHDCLGGMSCVQRWSSLRHQDLCLLPDALPFDLSWAEGSGLPRSSAVPVSASWWSRASQVALCLTRVLTADTASRVVALSTQGVLSVCLNAVSAPASYTDPAQPSSPTVLLPKPFALLAEGDICSGCISWIHLGFDFTSWNHLKIFSFQCNVWVSRVLWWSVIVTVCIVMTCSIYLFLIVCFPSFLFFPPVTCFFALMVSLYVDTLMTPSCPPTHSITACFFISFCCLPTPLPLTSWVSWPLGLSPNYFSLSLSIS